MRAEYLRQWLISATRDDSPDATNLLKGVDIVQAAFQDGTLAEECKWQTVVITLKGKGDFWGIVLVEVLWKAIARLLNLRLTSAISFHDTLHGFWEEQGMGTAAFEAKLLQQLAATREAVLFKVFLDLCKA